jgi:hypothetical protein
MGKYSMAELIISSGIDDGEKLAVSEYPYLVERDTAAMVTKARDILRRKFENLRNTPGTIYNAYQNNSSLPYEVESAYINNFVTAYFKKLAKLDEKAGISLTTPATPSNTATLQGAKIILTRVERKTNEYVYHLELVDPENFDGVERTEWVVYFEGASVPATEATTPTAAYVISSSDVAFAYGSPTSQKSARKPKGSYLRKP